MNFEYTKVDNNNCYILLQAIDKHLIKKSRGGFTYAGVYNYGSVESKMEHLVSSFG